MIIVGGGDSKSICIRVGTNGLGDHIHSLPAISQKVADGFAVTIQCPAFYHPMFVAVGCSVIDWVKGANENATFVEEHYDEYGDFHELAQWCFEHERKTEGNPTIDRFQQFADLIETTLPETFAWPFKHFEPSGYYLISPFSNCDLRSYPRPLQLRGALTQAKVTNVIHLEPKSQTSLEALTELVRRAERVVTVDNGILALALATGVPVTAIFGPTDIKIIAEQFKRYTLVDLKVLNSEKSYECKTPCNFSEHKGYGARCADFAECLMDITPQQIIDSL